MIVAGRRELEDHEGFVGRAPPGPGAADDDKSEVPETSAATRIHRAPTKTMVMSCRATSK
jgi:hypothetical protein